MAKRSYPASVRALIRGLSLAPHPEGGWFRETWRSPDRIPRAALPPGFSGPRAFSTSIVYLLPAGARSRWHRVRSAETWYYHLGGPLELVEVSSRGRLRRSILGPDPRRHRLQHTIPGGTWFAARPLPGVPFTLAGCSVAPGFDFADFELGDAKLMAARFPRLAAMIRRYA